VRSSRLIVLAVAAGAIAASVASGTSRVNGGTPAKVQQAPWTVFVQTVSGNTRYLCTGSVVDASHILTAGHCLYDSANHVATPSQVSVRAGVSNFSSPLPTDAEQDRGASVVRIHPAFVHQDKSTPDDVAVIGLVSPLDLSGSAVQAVALPAPGSAYPDGAAVGLAGFGTQQPTVQASGQLSWMTAKVDPQGQCGDGGGGLIPDNAVILCATSPSSAVCNGDSGSGLVTTAGTPTLVGIVSASADCDPGDHAIYTYTGAPEIEQFIQGSDQPPAAPHETAATSLEVKWDPPLVVGNTLTCSTAGWSAPSVQVTYSYVDSTTGKVLQAGPSPAFLIPASASGATVVCEVAVSSTGGTAVEETEPTPHVKPAPQVSIVRVAPLSGTRGHAVSMRVSLKSPLGLWGKFAVCVVPPKSVAGRLCHSIQNADGNAGTFPFVFAFRVKPTAPVGGSRISIDAVAGVSHAVATAPLRISKS
jgi:hypothetical protein